MKKKVESKQILERSLSQILNLQQLKKIKGGGGEDIIVDEDIFT